MVASTGRRDAARALRAKLDRAQIHTRQRGLRLEARDAENNGRYNVLPSSVRVIGTLAEYGDHRATHDFLSSDFPLLAWQRDAERRPPLQRPYRRGDLWCPPVEGCLEAFIRLHDASPEKVRAFAEQWGPLLLCRHHKPYLHHELCMPLVDRALRINAVNAEPVEAWNRYARQLRAILSAAANLRLDQRAQPDDWEAIVGAEPIARPPLTTPEETELAMPCSSDHRETMYTLDAPADEWWPEHVRERTLHTERAALGECLDNWRRYGGVELYTIWWEDEQAPFTTVMSEGLPGVLAHQLIVAITSPEGVSRCDGCGEPYMPLRRPRSDRKHYCPACAEGSRAAKREWWRANRARPAGARDAP
jgi:hypothetical protein